jgi:hypothetical protein
MGGIIIVVVLLSELLDLSPYAAIILFFGLVFTRLFSLLGNFLCKKIREIISLYIHRFVFQAIVIASGIFLITISLILKPY